MEKLIKCAFCDGSAELISSPTPFNFKEKEIVIDQLFYKCNKCFEEFTTSEIDEITLIIIDAKYAAERFIISPINNLDMSESLMKRIANRIRRKAGMGINPTININPSFGSVQTFTKNSSSITGNPITSIKDDPGLTDNPEDERINTPKDSDPKKQNKAYLVLSDEERAKGFIRLVRRSYIHVGKDIDLSKMRELYLEEKIRYKESRYVGYIPNEDKESDIAGIFIKERDLKPCNGFTTMSLAIAETYARDPKFYGSSWCCGCNDHHPVDEFVWDGTDERLGS